MRYTILGATREKWVAVDPSEIRPVDIGGFPAGDVSLALSSIRGERGAAPADASGWFEGGEASMAPGTRARNSGPAARLSEALQLSLSPVSDQDSPGSSHGQVKGMADEVQVVSRYSAAAQTAQEARIALEEAHAKFAAQAEAARVDAEVRTMGLLAQAQADAASIIERRKTIAVNVEAHAAELADDAEAQATEALAMVYRGDSKKDKRRDSSIVDRVLHDS